LTTGGDAHGNQNNDKRRRATIHLDGKPGRHHHARQPHQQKLHPRPARRSLSAGRRTPDAHTAFDPEASADHGAGGRWQFSHRIADPGHGASPSHRRPFTSVSRLLRHEDAALDTRRRADRRRLRLCAQAARHPARRAAGLCRRRLRHRRHLAPRRVSRLQGDARRHARRHAHADDAHRDAAARLQHPDHHLSQLSRPTTFWARWRARRRPPASTCW
jgi:hypothetical protein